MICMNQKIEMGSFVYRKYSNTYWEVVDIYWGTSPYGRGKQELHVKIKKALEKTLRKTEHPVMVAVPARCVELVTSAFYKRKGYFQQEGPLWDLVQKNLKVS